MTGPVTSLRREAHGPQRLYMHCPGCDDLHAVTVNGSKTWTWNGDRDRPTISPSILATAHDRRCHSYVVDGQWRFLGDCTHELAGQTVDLPPLPDWFS